MHYNALAVHLFDKIFFSMENINKKLNMVFIYVFDLQLPQGSTQFLCAPIAALNL